MADTKLVISGAQFSMLAEAFPDEEDIFDEPKLGNLGVLGSDGIPSDRMALMDFTEEIGTAPDVVFQVSILDISSIVILDRWAWNN